MHAGREVHLLDDIGGRGHPRLLGELRLAPVGVERVLDRELRSTGRASCRPSGRKAGSPAAVERAVVIARAVADAARAQRDVPRSPWTVTPPAPIHAGRAPGRRRCLVGDQRRVAQVRFASSESHASRRNRALESRPNRWVGPDASVPPASPLHTCSDVEVEVPEVAPTAAPWGAGHPNAASVPRARATAPAPCSPRRGHRSSETRRRRSRRTSTCRRALISTDSFGLRPRSARHRSSSSDRPRSGTRSATFQNCRRGGRAITRSGHDDVRLGVRGEVRMCCPCGCTGSWPPKRAGGARVLGVPQAVSTSSARGWTPAVTSACTLPAFIERSYEVSGHRPASVGLIDLIAIHHIAGVEREVREQVEVILTPYAIALNVERLSAFRMV